MPFHRELARRMAGPQRHRLLQGYPMLPLMRAAAGPRSRRGLDGQLLDGDGAQLEPPHLTLDHTRPLLIGVLPHAQCNPRVEGCGFCTFAHDPFDRSALRESVWSVRGEIDQWLARYPELSRRRVDAVYFGGATANLTPAAELSALGSQLGRHFDLSSAEVTLEGVPSLFLTLLRGPLDAVAEMPARQRRLSMGVQTFDPAQLERMGRRRFGDRRTVARVVERAHRRGLSTSADLLFNLPGQSRAQMLDDVRIAVELGLDQICLYHLVLHASLGTVWSTDARLLASLPDVSEASESWLALREALLGLGYVQTTLTNFERAGVVGTARRFVYEEHSFTPQGWDAIGFGPMAISSFANLGERRAIKHVRAKQLQGGGWLSAHDLLFTYDETDLRLLFVTRSLPRLTVDGATYRTLSGSDLRNDFAPALEAIVAAQLATVDERGLSLSARGMFFADAVAGLLAWERVEKLRSLGAGRHTRDLLAQAPRSFMG